MNHTRNIRYLFPATASIAALACNLFSAASSVVTADDVNPPEAPAATLESAPPPTDPATAIAHFDGGDPSTFLELELLIAHPASHPASAQAAVREISASDTDTRFAALYLLTNTGTPVYTPALMAALADPDNGLRAIAAGGLIGWGEKAAIPVLIESLTYEGSLPHSDPSAPIWILAQDALPFYTGEDFGLRTATTSAAALASVDAWRAWWDTHGEDLQWNAEVGRYE